MTATAPIVRVRKRIEIIEFDERIFSAVHDRKRDVARFNDVTLIHVETRTCRIEQAVAKASVARLTPYRFTSSPQLEGRNLKAHSSSNLRTQSWLICSVERDFPGEGRNPLFFGSCVQRRMGCDLQARVIVLRSRTQNEGLECKTVV